MCPLRPTAIATPGATASSIATFTILSSLAGNAVSSPELFNPIWGATYLIGGGGAAMGATGCDDAQEQTTIRARTAIDEKDFMSQGEGTGPRGAGPAHRPAGFLSKTTVTPRDNPCSPLWLSARA